MLATLAYENVSEVFTAFGDKGVSAEQVAREVVREVRAFQVSSAALGPHLTDQWVLPLSLAVWQRQRGACYTATELTDHATTNFETIQRFLPVRIQTAKAGEGWRVVVAPLFGRRGLP
ncbi:MAG: RNA 3'-terminal phosphate cyclase [Roseateles sp.]